MKNILIPIEKSSEGNTTIDEAVELAKKFDSKITFLNVDNSREILAEVNERRLIDDGRMIKSFGDHGLVDENSMPGATEKDNIKDNTKNYNKENPKDKFVQREKLNNKSFLDNLEKLYQDEGIETDQILTEGDPASAILDEVERGDYDLVIMRTHTMKERKRFMLGSVTNKVVHHINIPILIIR